MSSQFPRATPARTRRRRPAAPGAARTRVARHRFEADDTIPQDYRGWETCRSCRMVGAPGDGHHYGVDEPVEPPPQKYPELDPETRQLELRRLGEREDD
ncbi:hypothetical protein [Dactylosporangium salmoneum]|uniref:Uncharacterized protein n=1 Tax=Dactylosporangium salmoneum TaxID=53361 RepID=A0ABP5S9Q8_9ACTN